jgi:hypothetical protein
MLCRTMVCPKSDVGAIVYRMMDPLTSLPFAARHDGVAEMLV